MLDSPNLVHINATAIHIRNKNTRALKSMRTNILNKYETIDVDDNALS